MESKTPQFDVLIQPILDGLVPHTRECLWAGKHKHCEGRFAIVEADINFLRSFRVPPPNYCPTCRRMRRFVHMGTLNLFSRLCNVPGHTEFMISIFSQDCPFPVYDYKYFIGDTFDPMSFGKAYDPSKKPLEQLFEMRKVFPMPSFLNRDPASVNSDYSNGGRNTNNAYFSSGCFDSEDVWYTAFASKSREIMDSRALYGCDMVYRALFSDHLYKSAYIYFSENCSTSYFLYDCRNCTDCFGCVNLRNAKNCIFNVQYSKEDYDAFIQELLPFKRSVLTQLESKFWDLVKVTPMNASRNTNIKDTYGVLLYDMGSSFSTTHSHRSFNVRYAEEALSHKDSMDLLFSGGSSHNLYMTTNIGSQSSNVKFSVSSKVSSDSEFIFNSRNLSNCFMCFGLQNKSYCILNKQYTPDEYWKIVDEIKVALLENGEYADGLGMEFSAEAYNFSLGQISFPLTKEEITSLGGYSAKDPESNAKDVEIISASLLPDSIDEVTDDICTKAIACTETRRPFKITPSELAFYRKMKLPLPITHPTIRLNKNYTYVPMGVIYTVTCASCGKTTPSLYDKESGYTLYCESCFKREVI